MKTKKPTLTIGIPAHNEEANISLLLKSLLDQKELSFKLEKIIVYSDASTDQTGREVTKVKSRKIQFVESKRRSGKPTISNYFFKHAQTDIVVILDADIRLKSKSFLNQLVLPITKNRADLTSAQITELPAVTFVEGVLKNSMEVKRHAFESYNNGDNLYTCHGRARAFSRNFYRQFLANPDVAADDAYSYIMCQQMGFTYQYTPKAVLEYRLPQNITDHLRQSTRFFNGEKQLRRYFPHMVIEKYLSLPTSIKLTSLLHFALHYPVSFISYLLILIYAKITAFSSATTSKWTVANSSKALR